MADFERLMDQVAVLKRWSAEPPPAVRRAAVLPDQADTADPQMSTGERHGSWFLEMRWEVDGLVHIATIAITNRRCRTRRLGGSLSPHLQEQRPILGMSRRRS